MEMSTNPYQAAAVQDYRNDTVWSMFDILQISGIEAVPSTADSIEAPEYFDINGMPATPDAKGIIIVRGADGKTYKIFR